MNCEFCSESFNHSIRLPYEFVPCTHTLCLVCIQKKTDSTKKCPLCTVPIEHMQLNMPLNEIEKEVIVIKINFKNFYYLSFNYFWAH